MKKAALKLVIIFFTLLLIATAVILKIQQKQGLSVPRVPKPLVFKQEPQAIISFNPNELTISQVGELEVQVMFESSVQVLGADLEFKFDPKLLTLRSIEPGSFFPAPQEIQKIVNNQQGKASYSFGSFSPQGGSGILVKLTFKPKASGEAIIALTEEVLIVGVETSQITTNQLPILGKYNIIK